LKDVKEDATVNLQSCFQPIVVALGIAEELEDKEHVTSISNEEIWRVFKMIHDKLCKQKNSIIFQCEVYTV
jgi:hypothetical protein